MPEYIEREATLYRMKVDIKPPFAVVRDMPAADVEEVRHGEWRVETDEEEPNPMFKLVVCSACGDKANYMYNYCPHCGAKMDGGGFG